MFKVLVDTIIRLINHNLSTDKPIVTIKNFTRKIFVTTIY